MNLESLLQSDGWYYFRQISHLLKLTTCGLAIEIKRLQKQGLKPSAFGIHKKDRYYVIEMAGFRPLYNLLAQRQRVKKAELNPAQTVTIAELRHMHGYLRLTKLTHLDVFAKYRWRIRRDAAIFAGAADNPMGVFRQDNALWVPLTTFLEWFASTYPMEPGGMTTPPCTKRM